MTAKIHFYLLILLLFPACELLLFEAEAENSPTNNFNYLWKECKEKYAFFDYKKIDWERTYQRFQPFVSNDMTEEALFNILFSMLVELQDGHVNLIAPFNTARYNLDQLGPEYINWDLILDQYIGRDFLTTGPFQHNFIAGDRIGYIRYASFAEFVDEQDMNAILRKYADTEGLILDLRQNRGGSVQNVFTVLNRFSQNRTLIYRSYIKSGPTRNDFDGPEEAFTEPVTNAPSYYKKVAVLVDRGTYSAGSFFTLGARALPNMLIIGDTTGGGLGIPNGGQLPNGWTYRFSISRTLTPSGENFEDGVPPDIPVILRQRDVNRGIDTILERAIEALTS